MSLRPNVPRWSRAIPNSPAVAITSYRLHDRFKSIAQEVRGAGHTWSMSISLDGFVAGPDQNREGPPCKRGQELPGWHIGNPRANHANKVANKWLMRLRARV
jgi:hypothetical protein